MVRSDSYRFSAYSDLVRSEVILANHLFACALQRVYGVAVSCHLGFKRLMLLNFTLNVVRAMVIGILILNSLINYE